MALESEKKSKTSALKKAKSSSSPKAKSKANAEGKAPEQGSSSAKSVLGKKEIKKLLQKGKERGSFKL